MWKKNQGIKKFTSINTESTIRTIEYQFEYDEQVGTRGAKSISVDLAIEVAEYFHVSLDYLLLGKGMRTDELQKKLLQAEALIRDVATLI